MGFSVNEPRVRLLAYNQTAWQAIWKGYSTSLGVEAGSWPGTNVSAELKLTSAQEIKVK